MEVEQPPAPGAPAPASEIIFIDSEIDNWQLLLLDLPADAEVVILDPSRNGLEQIADHLSQRSNLSAIHIITHGSEATAFIGGAQLSLDNVDAYAAVLGSIGAALSETGDILFYGCDIAAGEDGAALVARIAALTGADIAASTDLTGAQDLGGDWTLEIASGEIEAQLFVGLEAQAAFGGLLAFTQESGGSNPMDAISASLGAGSVFVSADVTGDGLDDIIGRGTDPTRVVFWQNNGDGTWTNQVGAANPFNAIVLDGTAGSFISSRIVTLDMDGDGDIDLYNYNGNAFWRNDGATFTVLASGSNPLSAIGSLATTFNSFIAADFDGDGLDDVIGRNSTNTGIWMLRNNGDGSFTELTGGANPFSAITLDGSASSFSPFNVVAMDVNGDGRIDVFNNFSNEFWRNDGASFSVQTGGTNPLDGFTADAGGFLAGDFNGDGYDDLAARDGITDSSILFWRNNGNGTWEQRFGGDNPFNGISFAPSATHFNFSRTAVLDADGDGDLDIYDRQLNVLFENSATLPDLISSVPAPGAIFVSPSANIVLSFSESVNLGSGTAGTTNAVGYGDIGIYNAATNTLIERINVVANAARISGAGTATITIDPVADLPGGANIYVLIGSRAFVSAGTGNVFLGIDQADVFNFSVTANAAPLLAGAGGTTAAIEQVPVAIVPGIFVSDSDDPTLASATVSITGNFQIGKDVIGFANGFGMGNIGGSYNPATGVLTLTSAGASATTVQWQTALRAVTYTNTSDAPNTGDRTVSLVVNDGMTNSNVAMQTLTVAAVNDAPVLTAGGALASVDEDTSNPPGAALNTLVTANDTADGGTITGFAIVGNAATGVQGSWQYSTDGATWFAIGAVGDDATALALSATSAVRFLPAENFNGTPGALTVRALDASHGGGFTAGAARVTVDTTANGGATAISAATGAIATTITAVNDLPALGALTGGGAHLEGGAAILIDADVTVSDVELAALNGGAGDFAGASLTIARQGGAAAQDVLAVATGGSLTVAGANVSSGGSVIATLDTGTPGQLVVTFANNGIAPTTALVNEVMRAITYANTSDDPPASVTLDWTFSDGNTGNAQGSGANPGSVLGTATVTITPVNDPPTLAATGANPNYAEGAAVVNLFNAVTLSTVEAGQTITGLSLIVTNVADGAAEILRIGGVDVALTGGNSVAAAGGNANVFVAGATATVTLTETNLTSAEAQTLVEGLGYRNASDNPTTAANRVVTLTSLTDSGGTSDGGVATAVLAIASIVSLTAVNDAPTVTAPGAIGVTEDVASALAGISFTDADAGGAAVVVTFSVPSGTLAAAATGGVAVAGSGTGTLTMTGSIAAINAFVADSRVSFTTAQDATADVTLTVAINDQGNAGTGGAQAAQADITLQVAAVNDAPVLTLPVAVQVVEDVASAVTGISVADADAGAGAMTLTLGVSSGTLAATAGSGVTVAGSDTAALTLSGARADLNAFIAASNVTFTTAQDATADVTLTVTGNDGGNTGTGGALTDNGAVTLQVAPINDAPVIAGLGGDTVQTVAGGSPTLIDLGQNAVVGDVDSAHFGGGSLNIALTGGAANGAFSLGGIVATSGGDGALAAGENIAVGGVVIGTVDAMLDGQGGNNLAITLNADATPARVTLLVRDILFGAGSIGTRNFAMTISDGADTSATANFTVEATPNPPVVAGLGGDAVAYREGAAPTLLDFGGNASVTDADSAAFDGGELRAAITAGGVAAEDILSVVATGPVTVAGATVSVGGVAIGTVSGGTNGNDLVVALNANADLARTSELLRAIGYANSNNDDPTAGMRTVSFTIRDAAAGPGAATSAPVAVGVTVEAVNDAPTLTVPGALAGTEDQILAITGIGMADVDAGGSAVTLSFSVPSGNGVINAASGGGVTVAGSGTNALILNGSRGDINAFIAASNVLFSPAADLNGAITLTVVADDGGASGSGGALTATELVPINLAAANDAPTVTAPGAIGVTEDVASALAGISFTDADAGGAAVVVTFSVPSGTLAAAATGGVAVAGSGTGTLTMTGSIAAINAFVADSRVSFTTAQDATADVTLTVAINDQGNAGTGGAQAAQADITLQVAAVNDPPVLTLPVAVQVVEDVASPVTGITVADIDAGANPVQVRLLAPSGTMSAVSGAGVTAIGSGTAALVLAGASGDLNAFIAAGRVFFTTAPDATAPVALTVEASDLGSTGSGGAQIVSGTLNILVTPVDDAPRLGNPIGNQNASVGVPFAFTIPGGTFLDPDIGDAITLSVTREDGSPLPPWLSFNPANGSLTGTPPADFAPVATELRMIVRATDGGGQFATTNFLLVIAPDDSTGDVNFRLTDSPRSSDETEEPSPTPEEETPPIVTGDALRLLFDDTGSGTDIAQVFQGKTDLSRGAGFAPDEDEEARSGNVDRMVVFRDGGWFIIDPAAEGGMRPFIPTGETDPEEDAVEEQPGAQAFSRQLMDAADAFDRRAAALDLALFSYNQNV